MGEPRERRSAVVKTKIPPKGYFCFLLSHFYSYAGEGATGEVGLFGFNESDYAVFSCVNRKVSRHISTRAGNFSGAGLADENFAVFDFLATETLNAEALASIVMDIFGGTASFNM